jgi:hypothetical protein
MYSNFLLGCQNVLSEASSQLQHLQKEIFEFFRWPFYLRDSTACDPRGDLNAALVSISGIASDLARNQLALSSQSELRSALSDQISFRSLLSNLPTLMKSCHLCEKEWEEEDEEEGEKTYEKSREHLWSSNSSFVEATIEYFKQAGAICQEVLVRQAQVSAMICCGSWNHHISQIADCSAQIYSKILSINARAISMLGEAKYSSISTQQANWFCLLPGQDENNTSRDFLGRTVSHQLVDLGEKVCSTWLEDFIESPCQVQDRLGRTLLHLLCQKGSYECVERSLQIGADPSATTIYGHLPLHYAAQRGDYDMCNLLLRYKEKFDIEQEDEFGRTAYDYASVEDHRHVKLLLKDAAEEQRTSRTSSEDSM